MDIENPVSKKVVGGVLASALGKDRVDIFKNLFPENSVFFKTLTQNRHPFINVMGATEINKGYYLNNLVVDCDEEDFDPYLWLDEAYKKISEIRNNNPDLTKLALTTFKAKGTIGLSYSVTQDPICAEAVPARNFSVQTREEGTTQYTTTPSKIFRSVAANYVVKKITTTEDQLTPNLANVLGFILCMGLDEQWLNKSQKWFSMVMNHLMNTHFRAAILKTYLIAAKLVAFSKTIVTGQPTTIQIQQGWSSLFQTAKAQTYDLSFEIMEGTNRGTLEVEIPSVFASNAFLLLFENINSKTALGLFLVKLVEYIEAEYGKLSFKDLISQNLINDFDKPGSHKPMFTMSTFPFVISKNEHKKIQDNTASICAFLTNMRSITFELEELTFIPSQYSALFDDEDLFMFSGFYGLLSCCPQLWKHTSQNVPVHPVSAGDKILDDYFARHRIMINATTVGFSSVPYRYLRPLFQLKAKVVQVGKASVSQSLCIVSENSSNPTATSGSGDKMFNWFPVIDTSIVTTLPKRTKYLFPNYVSLLKKQVSGSNFCDESGSNLKFDDVESHLFICEVTKILADALNYTLLAMFQNYQSHVVGLTLPDGESYILALEAEANLIKTIHTKTELQNDFYVLMQTMFSKDVVSEKNVLNLIYNDARTIFKTLTFLRHCFEMYHAFVNDYDDSTSVNRDRILIIAPSVKKMIDVILSELTSYSATGDILPYCDMQYTTANFTLFSPSLSCTRINSLKYSTGGLVDAALTATSMQITDFITPVSTKTSTVRTVENLLPAFITTVFNSLFFKSCLTIGYDSSHNEFSLTGKRNRPGNELFSNYTCDGKSNSIFPIQPLHVLTFAQNLGCSLVDLRVITDSVNIETCIKILAIIKKAPQGKTQRVFWCVQGPSKLTRTPTTEAIKYNSVLEKAIQVSIPSSVRFVKMENRMRGVKLLLEDDREVQEDATAQIDVDHQIFERKFSFIPGAVKDSCFLKRTNIVTVQLKSVVLEPAVENYIKDVTTLFFITAILKSFCATRSLYLEEKGDFSFSGSVFYKTEKPNATNEANVKAQTLIQGNKVEPDTFSKDKEKEKRNEKENEGTKEKVINNKTLQNQQELVIEDPAAHGNVAYGIDLSSFTALSEAVDTIKVEVGESIFDITKVKRTNTFK